MPHILIKWFFFNLIVLPILWQDSSELLLKFEVGGRNKKIEGGQGGQCIARLCLKCSSMYYVIIGGGIPRPRVIETTLFMKSVQWFCYSMTLIAWDVIRLYCCDRLEFRRVKGSSNPRLCYCPPDRDDGRCFLPSGLCIVKIVKGTQCFL